MYTKNTSKDNTKWLERGFFRTGNPSKTLHPFEIREFYRTDHSHTKRWVRIRVWSVRYDCYTKYHHRVPISIVELETSSTSTSSRYTHQLVRTYTETCVRVFRTRRLGPTWRTNRHGYVQLCAVTTLSTRHRRVEGISFCWPSGGDHRPCDGVYGEGKRRKSDIGKRYYLTITLILSKQLKTLRKVT